MAQKTQIVAVALDKPTEKLLKERAKREDLPVSAVIRQALKSYLGTEQSQGQAV